MDKIRLFNLEQCLGGELIDFEHNTAEDSVSESEEVILHFSTGREILIYFNNEGVLMVEGD